MPAARVFVVECGHCLTLVRVRGDIVVIRNQSDTSVIERGAESTRAGRVRSTGTRTATVYIAFA